jgi:hypothetical protein
MRYRIHVKPVFYWRRIIVKDPNGKYRSKDEAKRHLSDKVKFPYKHIPMP